MLPRAAQRLDERAKPRYTGTYRHSFAIVKCHTPSVASGQRYTPHTPPPQSRPTMEQLEQRCMVLEEQLRIATQSAADRWASRCAALEEQLRRARLTEVSSQKDLAALRSENARLRAQLDGTARLAAAPPAPGVDTDEYSRTYYGANTSYGDYYAPQSRVAGLQPAVAG